MIYTIEVHELINKKLDVIGVETMMFWRTHKGDLKDCVKEAVLYVDGKDFNDINDRNFLIEEEFQSYSAAHKRFKWEKSTLSNYLD